MLSNSKEDARRDSAALHVAVYPSEACLPLYYADATGIFDSLGVDVKLLSLPAMEDCDTALLYRHAQLASTDIGRVIDLRRRGGKAIIIATQPTSLSLYTAKGKRITQVKQLRDRLVAIDRHSESDYRCDQQVERAGLNQLDVFRTQFNRHRLRFDMLKNGLVEAAFLDHPYSDYANHLGNSCIWQKKETDQSWTVLAMPADFLRDASRVAQVRLLIKGYQVAVGQINQAQRVDELKAILKTTYELPHAAVDTIPAFIPTTLQPLQQPSAVHVAEALQWLQDRDWITNTINPDSLITHLFFSK